MRMSEGNRGDALLSSTPVNGKKANKTDSKLPEILFMTSIAGASILFGFGMTLAMAKKRDPTFFAKGFLSSPVTSSGQTMATKTAQELHESGSRLAVRALGWGTLYAVSGFSLFSYSIWKLMGVRDLQEFRMKVGSWLPSIPKGEPQGRTEFESLTDLMTYLAEVDKPKTSAFEEDKKS